MLFAAVKATLKSEGWAIWLSSNPSVKRRRLENLGSASVKPAMLIMPFATLKLAATGAFITNAKGRGFDNSDISQLF